MTTTRDIDDIKLGDYVKGVLSVTCQGEAVDTLFDQGEIELVAEGGSGFHPAVRALAIKLAQGESGDMVASGGPYEPRACADIPVAQAPKGLVAGRDVVRLTNGLKARVTKVTSEFVTIDANPPLAGKDLTFSFAVKEKRPASACLEKMDIAAGCFWGIELAMVRPPGYTLTCSHLSRMASAFLNLPTLHLTYSEHTHTLTHTHTHTHAHTHTHTHTHTHAHTHIQKLDIFDSNAFEEWPLLLLATRKAK